MSNALKFKVDLEAFAEALDVAIPIVVAKLSLEAWTRLVERTPVDTGRARAAWTIKSGSPSDFLPEEGEDHQAPPMPELKVFKGTDSVYITNAVDYIRYLEDGSSKQAPAGMLRITLAELEAEAEFIIKNAA